MNDRVANSIRSLDAQRANRDLSYFPALNYFRAVNDITDQTFSCVFRQINMLYPAAKFFQENSHFLTISLLGYSISVNGTIYKAVFLLY